MNSLNSLATILRGCRPRRPSEKVRDALFGRPDSRPALTVAVVGAGTVDGLPARQFAPPARLLQVWFAPLVGTAVVVLSLASVLLPSGSPAVQELAFAALGGGWQSNVVQVERNVPPTPSFHSTTRATVASSFGSLLLRQTNVLVR